MKLSPCRSFLGTKKRNGSGEQRAGRKSLEKTSVEDTGAGGRLIMPPIHLPPSAVAYLPKLNLKPRPRGDRSTLVGGEETFGSGGFLDGREYVRRASRIALVTLSDAARVCARMHQRRDKRGRGEELWDTGDRKGQVYCVLERTCHNRK